MTQIPFGLLIFTSGLTECNVICSQTLLKLKLTNTLDKIFIYNINTTCLSEYSRNNTPCVKAVSQSDWPIAASKLSIS